VSFQKSRTQVIRERCRPAAAYSFTHLQHAEDRLFTEAGCSFSEMGKWLREDLFKFQAKDSEGRREYTIRYNPPPRTAITVPTLTVAIEHAMGFPVLGRAFGGLRGFARFWLTAATPMPLSDWIWQFFSPLQNLLTLATGRPNAIVHASVLAPMAESERRAESEVFFRPPYGRLPTGSRSGGEDSLFAFPSVRDRWSDICARWLALYTDPKMVRILDAYFDRWYRREFRTSDFQHLVQAVEAYHRLRSSGSHPGLAEYQARRAAILSQLSGEDRSWLASRLRARTEPNLETRLTQLLEQFDGIMRLVAPDREAFIEAVCSRRHELTHQGAPRAEQRGQFGLFQLAREYRVLAG